MDDDPWTEIRAISRIHEQDYNDKVLLVLSFVVVCCLVVSCRVVSCRVELRQANSSHCFVLSCLILLWNHPQVSVWHLLTLNQ